MVTFPARAALKTNPLLSPRTMLLPCESADSHELWQIVDSSRAWLRRWLPWVPYQENAESTARFVAASIADWDSGRAFRFTIRDRNTGVVLGIVGLESCVELHQRADLGYWLRREAAGQGFMTEAARACVDFGFRTIGLHRMRVAAATDNHPSLRVIARLGFRFEGVARHAENCDGRWLDHCIFGLLRDEWESQT
jgi:ribosomal-protein-serine acetyltransferase